MKVIIMAAGRGTRISRHLQDKPKCTIDINGEPLIKRTFGLLSKMKNTEISIVTGYNEHIVLDSIKDFNFTKFYNPFFDVTNSIVSLWFAKDFIPDDDDLIVMNGDVFFEQKVLDVIYSDVKSPLMLADSSRTIEADYKFNWSKDLILKKYGKDLSDKEVTGEYVGFAKIGKDFIPRFKTRLIEMINKQQHNKWWEDVLYSLSSDGSTVNVRDINGLFWAEVDYIEDYERIINSSKLWNV
jgi:L-glutamine-phosphate cytidylyltransferase